MVAAIANAARTTGELVVLDRAEVHLQVYGLQVAGGREPFVVTAFDGDQRLTMKFPAADLRSFAEALLALVNRA